MKAITIKQPWASLIVDGIKDIENRTWRTNFRGKVLIHSSASPPINQLRVLNEEQYLIAQKHFLQSGIDKFSDLPLSAIIGEVEIIDCVINHGSTWAEKDPNYTSHDKKGIPSCFGRKGTIYNWVLANPVKYDKPILNIKGKLSFWNYED